MAQTTKPSSNDGRNTTIADEAHEYLVRLGDISVRFARVYRMPRNPDGQRESDVEHSFHLALSAAELATNFFPKLDTGLVAQFCLVHDLVELYAGDTPSFNLSDEKRKRKEENEREAHSKLRSELPPHTAELLERYELQEEPEARFVRFVDKIMPAIIVRLSGGHEEFKRTFNITSQEMLVELREKEAQKLQEAYPEFDMLSRIRRLAVESQDNAISVVSRSPGNDQSLDKSEATNQ